MISPLISPLTDVLQARLAVARLYSSSPWRRMVTRAVSRNTPPASPPQVTSPSTSSSWWTLQVQTLSTFKKWKVQISPLMSSPSEKSAVRIKHVQMPDRRGKNPLSLLHCHRSKHVEKLELTMELRRIIDYCVKNELSTLILHIKSC